MATPQAVPHGVAQADRGQEAHATRGARQEVRAQGGQATTAQEVGIMKVRVYSPKEARMVVIEVVVCPDCEGRGYIVRVGRNYIGPCYRCQRWNWTTKTS